MEQKPKAWLYCHTEVADDSMRILQYQRRQLLFYARQLEAEIIGCSNDSGNFPVMNRSGFRFFLAQAKRTHIQALFIISPEAVANTRKQWGEFVNMMQSMKMEVFSPSTGCIISLQKESIDTHQNCVCSENKI